jgi:uncharacterized protein (DUF1015 family)
MLIRPFAGYRYNAENIKDIGAVIAPPYDVIDDAFQDALYARHPNNVVRLILSKIYPTDDAANNRYTRTAQTLAQWINEQILVRDKKPAIYVYHQTFKVGRKKLTRKGFMCACRATPFSYGMVLPHENTMKSPKIDRLMLTTACKMNFSQIFGIYPDENSSIQNILETAIEKGNFLSVEATDHLQVGHKMWVVDDAAAIAQVVSKMLPKPIFIADGHHRYETAFNYRLQLDEMGILTTEHPANYVLMDCVDMEDPGLIIMPTHRLFPGLPEITAAELKAKLGNYFAIEDVGVGADDAQKVWKRIEKENRQDAIGLYTAKDARWSLTSLTLTGLKKMNEVAADHNPEWREIGVSLLHRLIIETLLECPNPPQPTYVHLVDEVITELGKGGYPLAALVTPTTVAHIKSLSMLDDMMPAKSTYFYPKLAAGLVFNPLE